MGKSHRLPLFRILGLALGLWATFWFVHIWTQRAPLFERYYRNAYLRSTVVPVGSSYRLLFTRSGALALPSDEPPYIARQTKVNPKKLNAWLGENIYHDRPIWRVLQWPLIAGGFVLAMLISLGRVIDERSQQKKIARGPRLVSKWQFWLSNLLKRKGFYIETR